MNPVQQAAIKADILASNDMNTFPLNGDGAYLIANLYNVPASPTFNVWRTDVPVNDILDAIDFSKYTPVDAPELTGIYTARALAIQTKQMNLQMMLQGRDTLNAGKTNVRNGLRDAVIALPAGTSGASVTAGGASGANVMNACIRPATRLEKLLASAPVTTGGVSAGVLSFEGQVSYQDIEAARNT
jgi:hypothetical protein